MPVIDYPLGQKLPHYIALTRLDRPIGIFLLLWPTLWALWFAAGGLPQLHILVIFVLGTVLTRSAGCAVNDFADRHVDGQVERTRHRPLATGALSAREALVAAAILMALAFVLVLFTNRLVIGLSFVALLLACSYPFFKRITHWPQVILGMAFGFAIPMAWAAETGGVSASGWCLYLVGILWAVAYDTFYAMADRKDDLRIGVKSTAILFGHFDLAVIALVDLLVLGLLWWVGSMEQRGAAWQTGLAIAAGFMVWQLYSSRHRQPAACIRAFLNNHYVGLVLFIALFVDYHLLP